MIITIIDIYKVPSPWLKTLNKHNTHNVHINKGSSITTCKMHTHARTRTHTHVHTHAHTVYRLVRVKDSCLTEIFREEKCLELAFEGRVAESTDIIICSSLKKLSHNRTLTQLMTMGGHFRIFENNIMILFII